MITLNNLISLIQTFATNHKQLNGSWYFGYPWEQLGGGQSIVYPMMFGELKSSLISGTTDSTIIEFAVVDKCEKGNTAMRLEILSDTKLIALDFISYANSMSTGNIVLKKEISLEDLNEAFDDEVTGWLFALEFKQIFEYDKCSIPLN